MKYCILESGMGPVTIVEQDGALIKVGFGKEPCGEMEMTPLLAEAKKQLEEYFAGVRREFSLQLRMEGTEFQKKVWAALLTIPYGEVRTYGQIAAQVGNPKGSRAVGMANHYNPIGIIVPCHRVIGSNGKLTGYAGGLDKKEKLLKLEGIIK